MTVIKQYIPDFDDCERVKNGLNNYNSKSKAPVQDEQLRCFQAIGDNGEILGEAITEVFCGSLEIKLLYVDEKLKKSGIGKKLVEAIENADYGIELKSIFVWTTSWQAGGFYERCGYRQQCKVLLNTTGSFEDCPQYDILYYKELN